MWDGHTIHPVKEINEIRTGVKEIERTSSSVLARLLAFFFILAAAAESPIARAARAGCSAGKSGLTFGTFLDEEECWI